ncbi:MAG: hypothetical protein ABIH74_00085 [Candidatus Omnitrophota bacterium]
MAERLVDEGMNVIEVIDDATGRPMACLWLYINEEGALVVQNMEINPGYAADPRLKEFIGDKMIKYARDLTRYIVANRLLIGIAKQGEYIGENGYVDRKYKENRKLFNMKKIGGYLDNDYYLDSARNNEAYLVWEPGEEDESLEEETVITPERDTGRSGAVESGVVHGRIPRDKYAREKKEAENIMEKSNGAGRLIFPKIKKGLKTFIDEARAEGGQAPVDIVVDLSLMSKKDTEENMETWAYLILSCVELEDVNFIFEIPDPSGKGIIPRELVNDVFNAPVEGAAMAVLKAKIESISKQLGIDIDGDELFKKRIQTGRRNEAVEILIISKAWLEWSRDENIELEPDQYPVALEDFTTIEKKEVALRNFQVALMIGLSKASMAIAARRDMRRGDGSDEEFRKLMNETNLLPRLQKLYDILFDGKRPITIDTLKNMVYPDPATRMNLAISLALPKIVRMPVRKLQELHDGIQRFLHAA